MSSCQPDVPADLPVHGSRVRDCLGRLVCASCGGVVLLFFLAAGRGLKVVVCVGKGSSCVLRWHWGIGYEIGNFLSSLFFSLSGRTVWYLLLPDRVLCVTAFAGHVSYWAPRCLSGLFEVVALRTVLGIGRGMDLKVVTEAAAFERKEIVPCCYDDDI